MKHFFMNWRDMLRGERPDPVLNRFDDGITTISMSSKSKPAALGYGSEHAAEVQFRFEIAAAIARGTLPRLLSQLEAEKTHHQEVKPVPPVPPTTA